MINLASILIFGTCVHSCIYTYTENVGIPPLEPDSRGPFCGRDNKYQFLIQIGTGTYY